MKGLICYYSDSGNTKTACQYIIKNIKNARFELHNILKGNVPDYNQFDIIGFATFTDFGDSPQLMYSFLEKYGNQQGRYAFVFNTFGFHSFKTLKSLYKLAKSAGFNVIIGFSLHTPENYPPMRKGGNDADNAPNPEELKEFDNFINNLDNMISDIKNGKNPGIEKIKNPFIAKILPAFSRRKAKRDFGIQNVDQELCTECGVCMKGCPYKAITMNPKPVFDHEKCYGCWYCYNHCKVKAVYTDKFKGEHQYPKPNPELLKKLG